MTLLMKEALPEDPSTSAVSRPPTLLTLFPTLPLPPPAIRSCSRIPPVHVCVPTLVRSPPRQKKLHFFIRKCRTRESFLDHICGNYTALCIRTNGFSIDALGTLSCLLRLTILSLCSRHKNAPAQRQARGDIYIPTTHASSISNKASDFAD